MEGAGKPFRVAPMLDYRCYFLDAEGHIRSRREFEAKDDTEGVVLARALYAVYAECAPSHHGFELWQRSRLILTEKADAMPEPNSTLGVDASSNFARVGAAPPRV